MTTTLARGGRTAHASARPPAEPGPAARLIEALVGLDFEGVRRALAPDVRFRALVPSGIREAADRDGAIEWLRAWFGSSRDFEVLDRGVEEFAGRHRFWYRISLEREGRACAIDQEGFCDVTDGLVGDLALVCSGFRPVVDGVPVGNLSSITTPGLDGAGGRVNDGWCQCVMRDA